MNDKLESAYNVAIKYGFCGDCNKTYGKCNGYDCYENAVKLIRDLIDKADKYRWHDLRKNPKDLPKDINRNAYYDWLLLELDCGKYYTGWFRSDDKEFYIEDGCGGRFTNRVIKWREIEKFEEEE